MDLGARLGLRFGALVLVAGCSSPPSALGVDESGLTDVPRSPAPAVTGIPVIGASGGGATIPPSAGTKSLDALDYANPRIRTITSPESITDLEIPNYTRGRIRSEGAVLLDGFSVSTMQLGDYQQAVFAVVRPITWDVGSRTGFVPPTPVSSWQSGRLDQVDHAAFQLHGTSAGLYIDTRTFLHTTPPGDVGPHAKFGITYSQPTTPFLHPSSELTVQASIRVPFSASENGGRGQIAFEVTLAERLTGRTLTYRVKVWDSRPAPDGAFEEVTSTASSDVVVSSLAAGMRYSTVSPFSQPLRNAVTWTSGDFFRVHIPGSKLVNAVAAIEANIPGLVLSREPSDYLLVSAGVRQEVFVGTDPAVNMALGASVTDLSIHEFY